MERVIDCDLAPAIAARSPRARATAATGAAAATRAAATRATAATRAASAANEPAAATSAANKPATAATSEAAAPAATSAAAATTPSPGQLHAAVKVFPIEEMKSGEGDVDHFLFAKNEAVIGRAVVGLRQIKSWRRGCGRTTHQGKTHSGGTQCHHGAGFACALLLRSSLHSWHGRILRKFVVKGST